MAGLLDIEMRDAKPSLELISLDITSQDDVRSPRTPTYKPNSSFFANVAPFDPLKLFADTTVPQITIKGTQQQNRLPPKPSDPLAWVWQCHLCHSRWSLGVTRRCLVDGHMYCSGETDQPNLKKKKKGHSCSSEFDYVGWKDYGVWKRKVLKTVANPRIPKGCERCEFPSQCRYEPTAHVLVDNKQSGSPMTGVEYTSAEGGGNEDDVSRYYSTENFTFDPILERGAVAGKKSQSKMTDFYKPDRKRSKSECGRSPAGEKITKAASEKRKSKKSAASLAPIEEEALTSDVGFGLQDLVMPMLEFWNERGKRMSFP